MKPEKKAAKTSKTSSRNLLKNPKTINGYNNIKHFCKATLTYTRLADKDPSPSFILGYN